MTDGALILYNAVESAAGAFAESQAGVLNEVRAVACALDKLAVPVAVESIASIEDLPEVLARRPQRVIFNLVEELPQDIRAACYVPAVCEAHARRVTGNGTAALLLAQNKWQAKAVLSAAGVQCPGGITVFPGESPERQLPAGRYLVKPAYCDASEGIDADSVVDWPGDGLIEAVLRVHNRFDQPAMVEQFIAERELNVSVLQRGSEAKVLAIAEIDFAAFDSGRVRIVDYSAKWHADSFAYNNTPRIIPAPISEAATRRVRSQAIAAWHAMGCSGYARVDFRMDNAENTYVIEVNPNPDISPDAGFAAALEKKEINYESFVALLYDNALTGTRQAKGEQNFMCSELIAGIQRARPEDRASVLGLLERTDFFRPGELNVAAEVYDDAIAAGHEGDYQSFVVQDDHKAVGWICFGPTPCTLGTYDIYWLGVDPNNQRAGIGASLVRFACDEIKKCGGRLVVIETSASPRYEPSRLFYEKAGFVKAAEIADFYAIGDHKAIYVKRL